MINIMNSSKNILKKVVLLILFFNILFVVFSLLFYSDYKSNLLNIAKNNYELNINYFNERFKEKLLLFDNQGIATLKSNVNSTKYISDVKIEYKKYLIGTHSILHHTNSLGDEAWNLVSLDVDVKYGELVKLASSNYYEFIPSPSYDINESLVLRYQLLKDGEIRNFVTNYDLRIPNTQIKEKSIISFPFWFEWFYSSDFNRVVKQDFSHNNLIYATIEYKIDDTYLKEELYSYLLKFMLYVMVFVIPLSIWIFFYEKFIQKRYLLEPTRYLNNFIKNVLEQKFSNIDESKLGYLKDSRELVENIDQLSKKVGSLVNELNINKETLERSLLTDNLTGLYDKKMFEIDMKSMFVSSAEGYVLTLKIGSLFEIEALNGTSNTDNFILSYVNVINNTLNEYRTLDIKFYRFYGSEFAILAKDVSSDVIKEIIGKMINSLVSEISKSFKLPTNIFHIGATPFDSYGTIDSIMKSSNLAYEEAKSKNVNCGIVVNENTIKDKVLKLEEEIKNLVETNNFGIDFIYDSYSFDDNKLLMRELKPILKDSNSKDIQIGSFIAVCEKLEINAKFDIDILKKAIDFVENNEITYKVAINISIKSISSKDFLDYVEEMNNSRKETMSKIVFSITAYAALAYRNDFEQFANKMDELDIEILLKRYKTKEFPLDELSKIKISYLRIDKDLTQGISGDLMKKHRVKNILVYSEVNEVKLLTDSVQSNKDYEFLAKLDIYATSR